MAPTKRLCIIGAGPSSLAAFRTLSRDFEITIYEKTSGIGGVWNLESKETPMYTGLRTNIPRQLMEFRGEPFVEGETEFPTALDVQEYLNRVARQTNGFFEAVKLNSEVISARWDDVEKKWTVETRTLDGTASHTFDFLIVANGHYSTPYIPTLHGLKRFKGEQVHSKFYKSPEPFKGKKVLVVGGASSGLDISRLLVGTAKQVALAAKTLLGSLPEGVELFPELSTIGDDGESCVFLDGRTFQPDSIIWATGYVYDFPFLSRDEVPIAYPKLGLPELGLHVLPRAVPTLGILGLPLKVIPFPLAEYQSEFIKVVWTGKMAAPSKDVDESWLRQVRDSGVPIVGGDGEWEDKRRLELSGDLQWVYQDLIAELVDIPKTETWRWELRRKTPGWRKAALGY